MPPWVKWIVALILTVIFVGWVLGCSMAERKELTRFFLGEAERMARKAAEDAMDGARDKLVATARESTQAIADATVGQVEDSVVRILNYIGLGGLATGGVVSGSVAGYKKLSKNGQAAKT